jgi:hypothetical protein
VTAQINSKSNIIFRDQNSLNCADKQLIEYNIPCLVPSYVGFLYTVVAETTDYMLASNGAYEAHQANKAELIWNSIERRRRLAVHSNARNDAISI